MDAVRFLSSKLAEMFGWRNVIIVNYPPSIADDEAFIVRDPGIRNADVQVIIIAVVAAAERVVL